jgi:hypothetical protein
LISARCHRIGQQSKVRCLYVIAKGTLDEVLFMLLKKKFRDLGEFVEGKEEMDIVINQSYRDEDHFISSLCMGDSSNEGRADEDNEEAEMTDNFNKLANEDAFQHDIEELGMEEQATVKYEDDEEEALEGAVVPKVEPNAVVSRKREKGENTVGSSQKDAICLSDDEDDEAQQVDCIKDLVPRLLATMHNQISIPRKTKMPNSKCYYIYFNAPSYGFLVSHFSGRLVITRNSEDSVLETGHFICGVNEVTFPWNISNGIDIMKHAIASPPVRLSIVHNTEFISLFEAYSKYLEDKVAAQRMDTEQLETKTNESEALVTSSAGKDDVIQVLDD